MFILTLNKSELRQGDIIQGLYYPLLVCEKLLLIGRPAEPISSEALTLSPISVSQHGVNWLDAQVQVYRGLSIVLSQCCDLEPKAGKLQINSFVISPLLKVDYQIKNDPEKLDLFKRNTITNFINLYYISQQPPLTQEYMVDFGRVVSIPRQEFPFVLNNKILEMTDEARVRFKLKLGQHFGRPMEEERDLFAQLLSDVGTT